MAYFLSGSVIINDDRELIGIKTAGISTALYVGSNIQLEGESGIITATAFYGDGSNLSGVGLNTLTSYEVDNLVAIGSITATNFYGDGSALTNIPGLSWISTEGVPAARPNGDVLQDGDIYYDTVGLRQFTYYDGDNGDWRDSNPAANSALSVTVGASTALVVPGADTLTLEASPATGEVVIGIDTTTDTVTFGLDNDLRVGTSLQVGAGISAYGSTIISADGTPISYFGDGSNLTGIGLTAGDDVITTGNIQAGIITATTSLEATAATGVGLTVTSDAFISGNLAAEKGLKVTVDNVFDTTSFTFDYTYFDFSGSEVGDSVAFDKVQTATLDSAEGPDTSMVTAGAVLRYFDSAIQLRAGIVTATTSLEATAATGVGLTVTADSYLGGDVEVGAGKSVTAPFFYGDGSGLTGVGLESDSDVITTGNIQAGVITATTSLEATAATGVGLTVTADAYISGLLTADTGATIRTSSLDNSNAGSFLTYEYRYVDGDGQERLESVGFDRVQTLTIDDENSPNTSLVSAGTVLRYFDNATQLNAGIVTATTELKATVATGVGLTVTADAYIGGNVTIAGDLEANDVNTTSDISKKENVQEIGDALAKVSQLKGVTFDWKESGESSGGIIAQDVEKVLPTLVRDGDDHKTVIYNGVIGLLVQAVKELSEEVAELKKAQ